MSFPYISKYDSSSLRGVDDSAAPRPWNLIGEIIKHAGKNKKLLDIGCGTAFKLIPLSQHFNEIIGIDISIDMINAAETLIKKNNISNIKLIHGDSSELPFTNNTYDVVTCMLSRWDVPEIARVLKPNGIVIIEHIGCEDKQDFKMIFGKDKHGWRGQFLDNDREEYLLMYYKLFCHYFDTVSIKNGFWKTHYDKKGIEELLRFTPTIRNYDIQSDAHLLQKAFEYFDSSQGFVLTQNRILIHAKNIKCPTPQTPTPAYPSQQNTHSPSPTKHL
jgi:SAM-dependent methyltransferase